MATIKSYTDLEQSKKLAEILPLESADMSYSLDFDSGIYEISTTSYKSWVVPKYAQSDNGFGQVIPCWSLAALLNVIPCGQVNRMANSDKWEASSWDNSNFEPSYYVENYDNPVDTCVAMIERLHKLKML